MEAKEEVLGALAGLSEDLGSIPSTQAAHSHPQLRGL